MKQIYESDHSIVYRITRKEDNKPIILKMLKEDYPSPEELTRYRQEYEITKHLADLNGVINVYRLEAHQNTLVIDLEDFGGESLKYWLTKRQFNLDELLTIAIRITEILGEIHKRHIIHKDINPANVIFNPTTKVLKMIDFGISTQLSRQHLTLKNPNVLEGTLVYMSPEQTGRMNRALDYRTDFYSLGATFYELFTGILPFETTDPMELVHCHIAKQPLPPTQVNPDVPRTLSNLIMKLLEKTAEERYQSAWGIKADLEECKRQLAKQGKISFFTLAQKDFSERFQISQKCYGREQEIETLLAAFERVAADSDHQISPTNGVSKTEMMLITGSSGTGKSLLVKEIDKLLIKKRGFFISGKFDQFQRHKPYTAIVNVFGDLVQQLLTEGKETLYAFQDKVLKALGTNGQIIIDVIPEIELIIGKQPTVPLLGITESKNRFNFVFQNFMRAFCQPEHPLVIFLDDLQWVDLATLKLLEMVMTNSEIRALFLIGAYRNIDPTHPLMMTVDSLRKENVTINQITLKPLAYEHINLLIADSLRKKSVASLTELVMRKTGGNPFFVNQFLHTLYEENLLTFISPISPFKKEELEENLGEDLEGEFGKKNEGWQWNIAKIEAVGMTDNVVDLMISKLKKLPESAQQALCLAACIGNHFDLETLSLIYEKSVQDTFHDLKPVVTEGLILPTSKPEMNRENNSPFEAKVFLKKNFSLETINNSPLTIHHLQFLHDRVQEAAYALIADKDKKAVHLKIGRLLLTNSEKRIQFDIVDHLNIGQTLITNEQEQIELAQLNLETGRKAKEATAYAAALQYLNAGMLCLNDNSWTTNYDLTFNLYKEKGEVEFLNTHFEQSEELIRITIKQANTAIKKAELYQLLVVQSTMQGHPVKAIQTGKQALALLGIELPEYNLQTVLQLEVAEAKRNLGDKAIASLIKEPEMRNPEKRIAVKLLVSIATSAYLSNFELYAVIILKMVNLSLKYGPIAESSKAYGSYGLVLGSLLGDYQPAYEFALLGVKLSERFNNMVFKCQAHHTLGNAVQHWVKHIKWHNAINDEGYQAGIASGEIFFAGIILGFRLLNQLFENRNLNAILEETEKNLGFAQKTKNKPIIDCITGIRLIVLNLTANTKDKSDFHTETVNEREYIDYCQENHSVMSLCLYQILKLQVLYLYEQPVEALENALKAQEKLPFILGLIPVAEHNFYYSLVLFAFYSEASEKKQEKYLLELNKNIKQMKKWADNCPENFLHKLLLLQAEKARIFDNTLQAMDLYDKAIASAKENEFIQNEALGNELAAKFWLSQGKEKIAKIYMQEAYYGYQQWGAIRKIEDIKEKHPQLLSRKSAHCLQSTISTTKMVSSSIQNYSDYLDLSSVIKASHALSGEIVLSQLLEKMMYILIENAGAEKGFLLLPQQDEWLIEAEGYLGGSDIKVLQSISLGKSQLLPENIIYYVARTQESLVLQDATKKGHFIRDPYIMKHRQKSVLCMPFIKNNKLTSILYLENNLTTGAFTQNHLKVLDLLSAQIAISIENAYFYTKLEEKVAERTRELHEKNKVLVQLNQDKNEFLGIAAHDLKNPLSAIKGFAEMLQEDFTEMPEEEVIEVTGLIQKSSKKMFDLITNLLDVNAIESGKMNLSLEKVNLLPIVQKLVEDYTVRATAKNIRFQTTFETSEEFIAFIDKNTVHQVLDNLISNAVKYSPIGKNIRLRLSKNKNVIRCEVQDEGAGLSQSDQQKLFGKFTRLTTKPTGDEHSTGLGLFIVKKLVESMDGSVWCQSELGKGATFLVEFPTFIVSE